MPQPALDLRRARRTAMTGTRERLVSVPVPSDHEQHAARSRDLIEQRIAARDTAARDPAAEDPAAALARRHAELAALRAG